jgi:hypothetical protein
MTGARAARPILKKRGTVCPGMHAEIFPRCADFAIECVTGARVPPE